MSPEEIIAKNEAAIALIQARIDKHDKALASGNKEEIKYWRIPAKDLARYQKNIRYHRTKIEELPSFTAFEIPSLVTDGKNVGVAISKRFGAGGLQEILLQLPEKGGTIFPAAFSCINKVDKVPEFTTRDYVRERATGEVYAVKRILAGTSFSGVSVTSKKEEVLQFDDVQVIKDKRFREEIKEMVLIWKME